MELIIDDYVVKVMIRKRKSILGSGGGVGSKLQTSATPKSKDIEKCQVRRLDLLYTDSAHD
jgi:hypothetical protein